MKEQSRIRKQLLDRELWALLVIVLASLVLRVMLIRVDRIVRWDEPDYLILGRNLFTGQGYTVSGRPELHYAPLFPIVTGMLYPLTKDMKLNSDICFIVFGTLTLLPFYGLAKRLWGLRIGLMGTVFLCVFPPLTAAVLFWGTMLEPLYLFLLYGALCAVWSAWEEEKLGAYLTAGALFGLAYLTKPEAVVYLGFMFFLLFLARLRLRPPFTLRTGLGLLVGVLAFVAVVSPYIAFLYRHTGRVMVSGKLGVTYVAGQGAVEHDPSLYDRALSRLDKAGDEIIWFSEERFTYSVWNSIKADPRGFVRRIWRNVNTLEEVLFARQVFPFYFLLFLGLGWFSQPWNKERAIKEAFLFAIILPVSIFLPFHIELRYFAPMLPVLLLGLVKGIDALADWLQRTWASLHSDSPSLNLAAGFSVLVCALVVLYFLLLQPRVVRDGLAGMNPSRREAGLWLKAHAPPDALIMSRDTEIPFYAERRWAATPHEDYSRFIAYVRKRGANYLVVDEREITVIRPQLRLLLNEDTPPSGLRHVYTAHDPRGKTIVYEVLY